MNREKLSAPQWGALLWTAALSPAAALLPGAALDWAGKGAWLSPLAAAVLLLPVLSAAGQGGAERLRATLPGKVVLGGCVLWMELLLVLRLGLCARRMLWSGGRDGAAWYFLLVLAAVALWMGQGRLTALGRAGQLFLGILLGAAVLVLGLSALQVRPDRVLPLWTGDLGPVLLSGVPAAGGLCCAVLPMLLLPVRDWNRGSRMGWGLAGCVLLTLAQFIIVGNLGAGLAGQSDSAFFALTKSVGVKGAFQRVESVVAALWMLSDLTLCVALTHAIGTAAEESFPWVRRENASSLALLLGTGFALWLIRRGAPLENWDRDWVWIGSLGACLAAAGGIAMGKKTKTG